MAFHLVFEIGIRFNHVDVDIRRCSREPETLNEQKQGGRKLHLARSLSRAPVGVREGWEDGRWCPCRAH